jgi:hypothetical protein
MWIFAFGNPGIKQRSSVIPESATQNVLLIRILFCLMATEKALQSAIFTV